MIVPKKNAKSYGVVHNINHFNFLGFCKNTLDDEKTKVDIYINNNLVDTINCDKYIQSIDDIYDLDEQTVYFEYSLPVKYLEIDSISFRNHTTNEELKNSPIFINKQDPTYNNSIFYHSLSEFEPQRIKDLYTKNSIGFFAIRENMENSCFVNFINRINEKIPNVKFKIFYTYEGEKELVNLTFKDKLKNASIIRPKNIYEVAQEVEVLIALDGIINSTIVDALIRYNKNIMLIFYPHYEEVKLIDLPEVDSISYKVLKKLNIDDDEIRKSEASFVLALWRKFFIENRIDYKINENTMLSDLYFNLLRLCLINDKYKSHFIKINYLYCIKNPL